VSRTTAVNEALVPRYDDLEPVDVNKIVRAVERCSDDLLGLTLGHAVVPAESPIRFSRELIRGPLACVVGGVTRSAEGFYMCITIAGSISWAVLGETVRQLRAVT
jgi:hypothetical protein